MNKVTTVLTGTILLFVLAACATSSAPANPTAAPAPTSSATTGSMAGMDHGSTDTNAPFDAMFIDSMIEHHQGAIEMAKEAQQKAAKPEVKQLAEAILKTQQAEIDQMNAWRKQWYPDLKQTSGMAMDMGAMGVSEGPEPYDVRFVAAMIPHHASAVTMAQQATQQAEHPELKKLAGDIIAAQTGEIEQMKQWYQEWMGKPYAGAA